MRNFYRVGDKVKIKPSSPYYDRLNQIPKDSYGEVYKSWGHGKFQLIVRWVDYFEMRSNSYRLSDVEPY